MRVLYKISLIKFLFLFTLLSGLSGWSTSVQAQTPTPGNPVYIYFFWGDGCPHCAVAKPYFESLALKYPQVQLKMFEIYFNQENQQLFENMATKYGLEQLAVPTFFIGPYYLQGYLEEFNPEIEAVVVQCSQTGCVDPGVGVAGISTVPTPTEILQPTNTETPIPNSTPIPTTLPVKSGGSPTNINQTINLEIPFLGRVNLENQSVVISTALIAFVDGFNPCSLWVLSVLLALTLHTGSRKKVFLIGLVFLTVTAVIYALFIAGLFSVIKVASFLGWLQVLVALIALFFALVNIKDYFLLKEGISFTIADDKKTGIARRIRAVMDASQSFWGLVCATVALAAGVSLIEFSCTAGFPVVWTNLLNAQNISVATFIVLLLLYMLIYQLDEMVIFTSAVVSLKASRLEEKHGRILKLVGGMLMLVLSIVMLVNPALMNNLVSSVVIFGIALLATLLVLFFHRVILPKFGIFIGSEFDNRQKRL
jgi:thiol-disulfide isomerase/thioredoxin